MKKTLLITLIILLNINATRCSEADISEAHIKSALNKILYLDCANLANNLNGITAGYARDWTSQELLKEAKAEYHCVYRKVTGAECRGMLIFPCDVLTLHAAIGKILNLAVLDEAEQKFLHNLPEASAIRQIIDKAKQDFINQFGNVFGQIQNFEEWFNKLQEAQKVQFRKIFQPLFNLFYYIGFHHVGRGFEHNLGFIGFEIS